MPKLKVEPESRSTSESTRDGAKSSGDFSTSRGLNQYSDAKRQRALAVIAECGESLTLAAQRLGVSIATLSRWRSAYRGPNK